MGHDLLGAIFVLMGTVLFMSSKARIRAWGFAVMMIANVFWYLFGFYVDSAPMMGISLVMMVVNAYGLALTILYLRQEK